MNTSIKRLIWLAAIVVVAGGLLGSAPVLRARADSSSPLMTLDPTSLPATLVSQAIIAGEDVVTNWTTPDGDTITVAGSAGSVLTIGTDSEAVPPGATATPYVAVTPPLLSTSAITGDQEIAQDADSRLSLSQNALAVGFDPSEAQEMVNEDVTQHIIGKPLCINFSPKGKVRSRSCDIQYLLQSHGSSDWYIADKIVSSARGDGHSALKTFRAYVTYNHHSTIDWDPQNTIPEGTCANVTLSVSLPSGVGISEMKKICPETLSPFFPSIDGFGADWDNANGVCAGSPANWRNDPSESVEYDAGGASTDNYKLWVRAWWINNVC